MEKTASPSKKDTHDLENEINRVRSKDDLLKLIENNLPADNLLDYLALLLKEKHLKKSDVITRSCLDKPYAYHIFSGQKKPSRQKALALALAFGLTEKETSYLLYFSETNQLNLRSTWDKIVIYALRNNWTVQDTNIFLSEVGETVYLE